MNDLGYLWADQEQEPRTGRADDREGRRGRARQPAYRDSLGWVLFRLGKYPEAVVELEKAAAGKKPDGVVLDHLGDAYLKLNQRDKAVDAGARRPRRSGRRKKPKRRRRWRKKHCKLQTENVKSEIRNPTILNTCH